MITSFDQLDLNKTYTYADYLTWRFQERVELLRGRIAKMSPAPSRRHQRVSWLLAKQIGQVLEKSSCQAYTAPFDVLLSRNGNDTVVQPDICVICDRSKLTDRGCTGAPEIIVEILSPGNSNKEMKDKFELYEENGVQEYWIVDPTNEAILIYRPDERGTYFGTKPLILDERAESEVLPGFSVRVGDIFAE